MHYCIVLREGKHVAVGDKRAQLVAGALRLLATQGLEGTSFAEVREVAGGSRGSTYHHFPGGKDELIAAALQLAASRAYDAVESARGSTPVVVLDRFVDMWRQLLSRSDQRAGCAVLAVTVATDSETLREQTGTIFAEWRSHLASLFMDGGLDAKRANSLAAMAISSMEGAVALARAERSMESFELVAEQLRMLATP
ncbi:hypothetical protein AZH51_14810 [Branchiibius sp. NY16-3462-2]|nr:hypothetical protein AZH51_14810 [Branchiibius sp. NY16-3462-2]